MRQMFIDLFLEASGDDDLSKKIKEQTNKVFCSVVGELLADRISKFGSHDLKMNHQIQKAMLVAEEFKKVMEQNLT